MKAALKKIASFFPAAFRIVMLVLSFLFYRAWTKKTVAVPRPADITYTPLPEKESKSKIETANSILKKIVGVTDTGWIVDDPFGDFRNGYASKDGDNLQVSFEDFEKIRGKLSIHLLNKI